MKTIKEEIDQSFEHSHLKGFKPKDPVFWSVALGWFRGTVELREIEYQDEINKLQREKEEIEVAFMRRQAD